MSDNLIELLERLNWARQEIEALQAEMSGWRERTMRLVFRPDIEPNFDQIIIEADEPVPVSIRARGGTIANEVRSCLDGLASCLAARNGYNDAYFPVADNEGAFDDIKLFRDRLARFRPEDREAVLAFRPFATGKDGKPGNLLLYGLHHADIKRKHHRLVLTATRASLDFLSGHIGEIRGEDNEVKAPGHSRIGLISHDSHVAMIFTPNILYAEPDVLRGRPFVKTLHDFADVGEAVVRAFL